MMSETSRPRYSIVAPAYNEEPTLAELNRRIAEVMDTTGESWELIIVNDGSQDRTSEVVKELHAADPRVKLVDFSRNFGHQLAVTAGLDHARGDAVVMIDADLQDPPEVILDMIERWKDGYEVVYAVRSEREGETWFKEFTAKVFYRLIYRITDVDIPMDTGDFRLLDRSALDVLNDMRERHRFIRGMSVWVGFRQTGVTYKRRARVAGETKYPFRKMLRFALDAITSFSYLPLQLASYLGFAIAGLSGVLILAVILLRLLGSKSPPFYGQASTLVAVLFLGGVQLISIGIIGEYLGRIYDEVKARPLYIVRDTLGFDDEN
jgi:glycosyltransferase involved in cell wall biosynthesis